MYVQKTASRYHYSLQVPLPKVRTFEECGIHQLLIKALYSKGIEKPNELQKCCFPPMLKGKDMILKAYSGAGCTTALAVGTLHNLINHGVNYLAMMITSTEAKCSRISAMLRQLAGNLQLAIVQLVTQAIENWIPPQGVSCVVVGTPIYAIAALTSGLIQGDKLLFLVAENIDEFGQTTQLEEIIQQCSKRTQLVFAHVYDSPDIEYVATLMKSPIMVESNPYNNATIEGIKQFYVQCQKEIWKQQVLVELIGCVPTSQCHIFANSDMGAERIATLLKKEDMKVELITPLVSAEEVDSRVRQYLTGELRYLVLTDALLIPSINYYSPCTISYDLPPSLDEFVRRVGRSGAFGRRGVHIVLLASGEETALQQIIRELGSGIEQLPQDVSDLF